MVGRGLAAAAVMGQLRSAGRALLLESRSPAHVLSALDRFAALVPGAAVSTVFCAVINLDEGTLRYSSAGHPPAIVVEADGRASFLEDAGSLPLAVADDLDRPEADVVLPPGLDAAALHRRTGRAPRPGDRRGNGARGRRR